MTQKYHIKSKNTGFYLLSEKEADQDVVSTRDGRTSVPEHSILTFTPPVEGSVVVGTITGVKNLYVALPKGAGEDTKLIWSKEKYEWIIRLTPKTDNSDAPYEITPADGKDLYWLDKFGIGNVVIVKAGKNVEAPQHYWNLTKA